MFVIKIYLLLIVVVGAVYCEEQVSQFNDTVSSLSKSLGNELNPSQTFDVLGYVRALFIEKCKRNGVSTLFLERDPYSEEVKGCQVNIVDKDGLVDSYQRRDLRDAMKKVCAQTPHFKECSITEVTRLRPCLSAEERPYLDNYLDGESQLYDYLCYNDGERVIRFLEGKGLACVKIQPRLLGQYIQDVLENLSRRVSDAANATSDDNMFRGPLLKETCKDFLKLKTDVVAALKECQPDQRADYVDFVDTAADILLKATPCKDQMPRAPDTSSALSTGAIVAIVVGVALLVALAVGVYRWRRRRAGAAGGEDAKRGDADDGRGAVELLPK